MLYIISFGDFLVARFNCFFFLILSDLRESQRLHTDSAHKEERATLLEDWANMEAGFGSFGDVSVVQSLLPKKLKKRKAISREDGSTEYALH